MDFTKGTNLIESVQTQNTEMALNCTISDLKFRLHDLIDSGKKIVSVVNCVEYENDKSDYLIVFNE